MTTFNYSKLDEHINNNIGGIFIYYKFYNSNLLCKKNYSLIHEIIENN